MLIIQNNIKRLIFKNIYAVIPGGWSYYRGALLVKNETQISTSDWFMKNYPSKLGTVIAMREQTSRLSRPSLHSLQ
jgi:hypothetical protein